MQREREEIQELKHDAVPGGRAAFYIVTAITVLYLTVIFLNTF